MSPVAFVPPAPSRHRAKPQGELTALPVRLLLVLLTVVALSVSGFLAYLALSGAIVPGCSNVGLFSCDKVLSTQWSKWFNLPVALPAATLYATMLVLLPFTFGMAPPAVRQMAWRGVGVLAACAALAGLWFIGLQFALGNFCAWCLTVHVCGLLLALLVFAFAPAARSVPVLGGVAALAGVAVLVTGQLLSTVQETYTQETLPVAGGGASTGGEQEPIGPVAQAEGDDQSEEGVPHRTERPVIEDEYIEETTEPAEVDPRLEGVGEEEAADSAAGENNSESSATGDDAVEEAPAAEPRLLTVHLDLPPIDLSQQPMLGSPDAEHVIVEMFDYTCPSCRAMYDKFEAARERYGEDFAVVLLPVPMNSVCNRYVNRTGPDHVNACVLARYALAVWLTHPEEFEDFHAWLMEGEDPPSQQMAQLRAGQIVGATELLELSRGEEVAAYLDRNVDIYGVLGAGTIPKILFGSQITHGPVLQQERLFEILEDELPLVPAGE